MDFENALGIVDGQSYAFAPNLAKYTIIPGERNLVAGVMTWLSIFTILMGKAPNA
jgi:hypothetical protein